MIYLHDTRVYILNTIQILCYHKNTLHKTDKIERVVRFRKEWVGSIKHVMESAEYNAEKI